MRQKNKALLFIASWFPGCGEMYQGYMKRGISLLSVFCGVFALAVILELEALSIPMIPIWLYSFFDSWNLRTLAELGTPEPDSYLFGLSEMDREKMDGIFRNRHSVTGWSLVGLGIFGLWTYVARWLSNLLPYWFGEDEWLFSQLLRYTIPRVIVSALVIFLGVRFIRGPRRGQPELPPFTPPVRPSQKAEAPESAPPPEERA